MTIYQALAAMREQTEKKKPFSFSFMSYNSSKGTSGGVVSVRKALLRKRAKGVRNGEYLMDYYDVTTGEDRRFYTPLLMTFNDVTINSNE